MQQIPAHFRGRHHLGLAAEEAPRAATGRRRADARRPLALPEGELDLVVELPSEIVFVEVKAARPCRHAADAVTPRQSARIGAAASRYLAENTDGSLPAAST